MTPGETGLLAASLEVSGRFYAGGEKHGSRAGKSEARTPACASGAVAGGAVGHLGGAAPVVGAVGVGGCAGGGGAVVSASAQVVVGVGLQRDRLGFGHGRPAD